MTEEVKRGPGRPRKDATPAPPARKPDPEPCELCFPDGWAGLGKDAYSAGCAHGITSRDIPA